MQARVFLPLSTAGLGRATLLVPRDCTNSMAGWGDSKEIPLAENTYPSASAGMAQGRGGGVVAADGGGDYAHADADDADANA